MKYFLKINTKVTKVLVRSRNNHNMTRIHLQEFDFSNQEIQYIDQIVLHTEETLVWMVENEKK